MANMANVVCVFQNILICVFFGRVYLLCLLGLIFGSVCHMANFRVF